MKDIPLSTTYHPKVFISYTHDSAQHKEGVLALSEKLRADGVDCRIDQYEISPPQGWPRWMINNLEEADFILVLCTENYAHRLMGNEAKDIGIGAQWEGKVIIQTLYEAAENNKVVPVLFSSQDKQHIPIFLRDSTYYDLSTDRGYELLSRHITNQPLVQKGELGQVRGWSTYEWKDNKQKKKATISDETLPDTPHVRPKTLSGKLTEYFTQTSKRQRWLAGIFVVAITITTIVYLSIGTRSPEKPSAVRQVWEFKQSLIGHRDNVSSLAFSSDNKLIASGSFDGTVILWNPQSGEKERTLEAEELSDYVNGIAFSPDNSQVTAGVSRKKGALVTGSMMIWNSRTGIALQTLTGYNGIVFAVAFSPDGKRLASGGTDKTVILWDAQTFKIERRLKHLDEVDAVAFSPDSRTLASGSYDRTVKLWDMETGGEMTLEGHAGYVFAVAFSPDGRLLASGSQDKTVKVWDAQRGTLKLTLKGHNGPVNSVAFSPDGTLLASASDDQRVMLWDARTGEPLQSLERHTAEVNSVAFSPDGKTLVSGGKDKSLVIWEARTAPHN